MHEKSDDTIQVIAAVMQNVGRYLVCQRPPHKRHGNLWEFPGGKIEPGESLYTAAQRELSEELAITVTAIGAVRFTVLDPGSQFVIRFVDVEATGVPTALEHTQIGWFPAEGLLELALAPSDRQFAEHLVRALNG